MKSLLAFSREERGSVSIWNLFWLTGFCALLGLAVDVSSAMNTKARLQGVADASAHAGVMDISPTPDLSVVTAMQYGFENIPNTADVVNQNDVTLGWWDHDTKTFDTNNPLKLNAVQVVATRDRTRSNATDTGFLGMVGFHAWDINAVAVAVPLALSAIDCRANGLFAGGTMEQTSNNSIVGPYCMYGDTSFKISQNNMVECGVELITPSPDHFHNGTPPVPTSTCSEDYNNLTNDEMIAQSFAYKKMAIVAELEYNNAKDLLTKYINGEAINDPFGVIPPYITTIASPDINSFNSDARQGRLVAGTLYNVTCAGTNKKLELKGFVQNIAVFTDCEVNVQKDKDVSAIKPLKTATGKKATCDPDNSTCSHVDWIAEVKQDKWSCDAAIAAGFESYATLLDTAGYGTYRDGTTDGTAEACGIEPGANGLWDNVMVFTSHHEGGTVDQRAVSFPNNMQIGRIDGCTEGGGVRIYTAGSIAAPSGTVMHGLQIVTLGNVDLAAKADGAWSLNVQAVGDIKYTANGVMGGCDPDDDAGELDHVVTVRPISIVR